jgi:hypothetical protein
VPNDEPVRRAHHKTNTTVHDSYWME